MAPPRPPRRSPAGVLAATFAVAGALLFAAAVVAVAGSLADWPLTRWAALHLALLGGVSMLVLGAAQFFAGAFLATDPPSRAVVVWQRVLWPVGVVLVVVGRWERVDALVTGGFALLLVALALFAVGLRELERRSLQRAPWAVRWYQACIAFLVVGGALGTEIARGASWIPGDGVAAHVTLNVVGWLGTAIVGTVHTFVPSMVGGRLARPALQRPTFRWWVAGVTALSGGWLLDVSVLAVAGLLALLAATTLLLVNLGATARGSMSVGSVPAGLVLAGQAALAAALALALVASPLRPAAMPWEARQAIGTLLVAGWVGLTVAGSLLVLMGPVSRRGPAVGRLPLPRSWWPAMAPAAAAAVALMAIGELLGAQDVALVARILLVLVLAPVLIAVARAAWAGLRSPFGAPGFARRRAPRAP